MSQQIAGIHNGGVTQPLKMDISPDGDRLVAVGNFDTVGGVQRHQFLMLDISGATAQVGELPDHVLPLGVLAELRHLHARRRLLARRQLLRDLDDRGLRRQRERL